MIFVTVGTHEQQFNRLVETIDRLKEEGRIKEDVFIQTGYSTYEPKHCSWSKLIPYELMRQYYADARIVITHGGPASYIDALRIGKIPIVVPRQEKYGEHVNDHQVDHAEQVASRKGCIIPVYDITELGNVIEFYEDHAKGSKGFVSNNESFNNAFSQIVSDLMT